jgi:hypothetical protein
VSGFYLLLFFFAILTVVISIPIAIKVIYHFIQKRMKEKEEKELLEGTTTEKAQLLEDVT